MFAASGSGTPFKYAAHSCLLHLIALAATSHAASTVHSKIGGNCILVNGECNSKATRWPPASDSETAFWSAKKVHHQTNFCSDKQECNMNHSIINQRISGATIVVLVS